MYVWGLPLAGLCLTAALAAGVVTLCCLTGPWLWTGVAAVWFYASVMCLRSFDRSSCPGAGPLPGGAARGE